MGGRGGVAGQFARAGGSGAGIRLDFLGFLLDFSAGPVGSDLGVLRSLVGLSLRVFGGPLALGDGGVDLLASGAVVVLVACRQAGDQGTGGGPRGGAGQNGMGLGPGVSSSVSD